tara:strand:+ start:67 stop:597 length:531 start_codon:yes stop_codon:yes gene_type:complete
MIYKNIYYGFVSRIITTLIFFIFLKKMENIPFIHRYIYLIIFIGLLALDSIDTFYLLNINNIYNFDTILHKLYKIKYYQINDKIIDIFTYLLLISLFPSDNILKFLVLFRLIGILLYLKTKNNYSLVIFFDFIKEYLLYLFIFGHNYNYLPLFFILKIIFEFYLYTKKIYNFLYLL